MNHSSKRWAALCLLYVLHQFLQWPFSCFRLFLVGCVLFMLEFGLSAMSAYSQLARSLLGEHVLLHARHISIFYTVIFVLKFRSVHLIHWMLTC